MDFESQWTIHHYTQPSFLDHSQILVNILQAFPSSKIQTLMKLSDKLGELNYNRYQQYMTPFTQNNARPAITAFQGDTYVGLEASTLSNQDLEYAQNHLRMLSGLYGLLRPLDLIQAYRLEMGTKLGTERGEDLYDFWGDLLTNACNDEIQGHQDKTIISLASHEYIKAIKHKSLNSQLITCHFKELKDNEPKTIGLFAKRARGAMARFMIQNRIETPEGLKDFNTDGYQFMSKLSDHENYVFLREKRSI